MIVLEMKCPQLSKPEASGVRSDFASLDKYSSWRVESVVPMLRSAVRTTLRSLLRSDLVAELNQTVIDVQWTDSMMAE